jgi:hypothetical protein
MRRASAGGSHSGPARHLLGGAARFSHGVQEVKRCFRRDLAPGEEDRVEAAGFRVSGVDRLGDGCKDFPLPLE